MLSENFGRMLFHSYHDIHCFHGAYDDNNFSYRNFRFYAYCRKIFLFCFLWQKTYMQKYFPV